MKKISLLLITATVAATAFGQVKIGVQATGNLSSAAITSDDAGSGFKKSSLLGFGGGIAAEVPLGQSLSLRTGLGLLQKGVKVASSETDEATGIKAEGSFTNKFWYAEVPAVVAYNVDLIDKKFFIGAGPSLGIGVFGKSKGEFTMSGPGFPAEKETMSVNAFGNDDNSGGYKRLDLSANVVAGLQWSSGFYASAGYSLGLTSALPKEAEGSYKNRGIQLTLGMFLKNK